MEDWVRANGADLVLLDLMLPGKNGLEICKALRASTPDIAIIMVTARAEEEDRIRGLNLGSDDYVAKPFRFAVLLARIRAQLRQRPAQRALLRFVVPALRELGVRISGRKR